MAITAEGAGHLIQVQAVNQELGFIGYRVISAATATEAQASSSGVDCGALNLLPAQGAIRFIEAKPNQSAVTAGTSDRICAAPVALSSGAFVTVRATVFDLSAIAVSNSSNAVAVP